MRKMLFLLFGFVFLSAGILKEDNQIGIDIQIDGDQMRMITEPSGMSSPYALETKILNDYSRAEMLWVDRSHLNAIANHVSVAPEGLIIQAGWYLNNERTSCYRTLGSEIPLWTYQLPNAESYIPVDVVDNGNAIGAAASAEPFRLFKSSTPVPQWANNLIPGFKVNTSSQGSSVAVCANGSVNAVLASSGSDCRLFVFDADGDTIRTIQYNATSGIYGLDATSDGNVFCISTYYAIFIFELSGFLRDSLPNYGQTVAKISGNGNYVVKGEFNQRVTLYRWNGSDYVQAWQHATGHPWITAVDISEDGSTIFAGTYQYSPSNSGKVLMYDSSSSTPLWEYTQYGDYVAACALSANGNRAVAGSWGMYNGTFGDVVTVFDRTSSTPIFQLLDDVDEPGSIFSVDISSDGSFVTAGGKAVHARQMGNGGEVYAIRIIDSLTIDVGTESIMFPAVFLQNGQSIAPTAWVTNYGTTSATFNTVCSIYDSLNTVLYTDTQTVNNLNPGASDLVVFAGSWTVPGYGEYETIIYTDLTGDLFPLNDTAIVNSICYHDASVIQIQFPFAEQTVNYGKPPRVEITNLGSYGENIPATCEIYDSFGSLVYTGTGQTFLNPLQNAIVLLSPVWIPVDTDTYDIHCFTTLAEDFDPANDSSFKQTDVTTEILYDDGLLNVYGYVSGNFYDNKFAVKMYPCLTPPYRITRSRCFVSTASPMIFSINSDSSGLPGLGLSYEIAPPETLYPTGTGWVERSHDILMTNSDQFWMIAHWLSSSPTSPYVGMDNTLPRDSTSYWYWTEPSNYGWHFYPFYDFMMRVLTEPNIAVEEKPSSIARIFTMAQPCPNPGSRFSNVKFSIPQKGDLNVAVYDVSGRLIWNFCRNFNHAEIYDLKWLGIDNNGKSVSSGVYFMKAEFSGKVCQRKLVLIE